MKLLLEKCFLDPNECARWLKKSPVPKKGLPHGLQQYVVNLLLSSSLGWPADVSDGTTSQNQPLRIQNYELLFYTYFILSGTDDSCFRGAVNPLWVFVCTLSELSNMLSPIPNRLST